MTFRDEEKMRLIELKKKLFPQVKQDGQYKGKPYAFCLPEDMSAQNLHMSLRKDAIAYFDSCGIPWHDGQAGSGGGEKRLPSNHLCCSQSACVNTLVPMMLDKKLLAVSFSVFLPELAEVLPFVADVPLSNGQKPFMAFEWIGTRNYLGEKTWGTRGANATSTDFAFRFKRHDGRVQMVLGEWKYTEYYSKMLPPAAKLNRTRLTTYRDAFKRWEEASDRDLPGYEKLFVEPFYQLMRQTLLAREMEERGEMDADIVSVVHVSPKANRDFGVRFTSPSLEVHGRTVTDAWTAIAPAGRFLSIPSESLLTAIEQMAGPKHEEWVKWLLRRYGWWRD